MTTDYKDTVILPQTDFPMRGNLPNKEPEWLKFWQEIDLAGQFRNRAAATYVLHDGPPYANGNIHIGHATNKILKDVVSRAQAMLGKRIAYVPGWDCHGLPIEWKIEEKYRAKKQNKDDIPILDFRAECRAFAAEWVKIQSAEFQRLGIIGNWAKPYLTMTLPAEARIAAEIHKFLLNGLLYRGERSVMWSVVEQTALADAEIEYHELTSDTVHVAFPVSKSNLPALQGASIIIWTTTPWTMPANRAIAYGEDFDYAVYRVNAVADGSMVKAGTRYAVAKALSEQVKTAAQITDWVLESDFKGSELAGTVCSHPLRGLSPRHSRESGNSDRHQNSSLEAGLDPSFRWDDVNNYQFEVPLLPAEFVTDDAGTGFVHIAPSHGLDDFNLGKQHDLPIPLTVDGKGVYTSQAPGFEGARVYNPDGKKGDANKRVVAALQAAGNLVARGQLRHSYPHSWRSKAPLIFRTTPQWFIAMDISFTQPHPEEPQRGVSKDIKLGDSAGVSFETRSANAPQDEAVGKTLRQVALQAISNTQWVPPAGENRIRAMVESRPDWCISRQRAWGVPIAIFVDRQTGQPLRDEAVCNRIVEIFKTEGSDAWYARPAQDFLGDQYQAENYEQIFDIVDVWFESGSTHAFVLEDRPELQSPADLYLEGSDQHRGWFQSSLLESCGTRGRAPFKAVLTHGFVLDEQGRKMSKSLGNVVAPQQVTDQSGADILRLWVCNSDYQEDVRISKEILNQQADLYRRLRNTLRYLLGALYNSEAAKALDLTDAKTIAELPQLEQWVLHRLYELGEAVHNTVGDPAKLNQLNALLKDLHDFCAQDLSALFFDIRKDRLYCDAADDPARIATQAVMIQVFECLTAWLAPFICFTAEEAWQQYPHKSTVQSVHLRLLPTLSTAWQNQALADEWEFVKNIRSSVTQNAEQMRAQKLIGSSLELKVAVHVKSSNEKAILQKFEFKDICIISQLDILDNYTSDIGQWQTDVTKVTEGNKCERCWKVLPEVTDCLCQRCASVVGQVTTAA